MKTLWLLLLPGGSILFAIVWLRRRWIARDAAAIDALIVPPTYGAGMTKQNDALRLRTEARRKAADAIRSRAAHVETGASVSDVLRRVK